jgi:hypothetical protein
MPLPIRRGPVVRSLLRPSRESTQLWRAAAVADLSIVSGTHVPQKDLEPVVAPRRPLALREPPGFLLVVLAAMRQPLEAAHGDDQARRTPDGEALHRALVRAVADSRFKLLGGTGHEGAGFDRPASLAMTAAWLRTVLHA